MFRKKIGPSRPTVALLAALLGTLLVSARPAGADEVIDGDTLVVEGQRMRLFGVDAFELEQTCLDREDEPWRCGTAAKAALAELVQGEAIACTVLADELEEGYVARCNGRDGIDLGGYLVRAGLALPDPQTGKDYLADQATARAAVAGAWGGAFTPPWQWRSQQQGQ